MKKVNVNVPHLGPIQEPLKVAVGFSVNIQPKEYTMNPFAGMDVFIFCAN